MVKVPIDCFLCTKPFVGFDLDSLNYIVKHMTLCQNHTDEVIKKINPSNFQDKESVKYREPGEDG